MQDTPTAAAAAPAAPANAACPGLLRIVAARDGGICRVRLPGGVLTSSQARTLALASERHANGVIEATNRSNLQLRGVRGAEQDRLIGMLIDAGLGPTTPESDDVRNLMLSPVAGIDPLALLDTRPLARTLLARLEQAFGTATPAFPDEMAAPRLSPKFALQLDGGESLAMLDHHHDIWLAAIPATAATSAANAANAMAGVPRGADTPWIAFGLAGTVPRSGAHAGALGAVPAADVPDLVAALIRVFLQHARPGETRMRDLLRRDSPATVLALAQRSTGRMLSQSPSVLAWRRADSEAPSRFGPTAQDPHHRTYRIGAQCPLGRMTPAMLRGLASLADDLGDGTFRLTPWQGVILPHVDAASVRRASTGLRALGLIDDASVPLGAVVACAGNGGCAKGLADTKGDAVRLAAQLSTSVDVHLSGCPRSCAAAHRMPYTLLATESGRYDLYHNRGNGHAGRVDRTGRAGDGADTTSTDQRAFGQRVASQLTIDAAARYLAERTVQDHARNGMHDHLHDSLSLPTHPIATSHA